jgi:transcriptional regulator with XRE-family HTH domain
VGCCPQPHRGRIWLKIVLGVSILELSVKGEPIDASDSLRKGKVMRSENSGPNPVDIYVGARVRARRKALRLSQTDLANALNLTFQQVQKYERGTNRVSASKLWEIARTLRVPLTFFFEGFAAMPVLEDFTESKSEQSVNDFLLSHEGIELAAVFPKVKSARQRRKILELVRTLSEDQI